MRRRGFFKKIFSGLAAVCFGSVAVKAAAQEKSAGTMQYVKMNEYVHYSMTYQGTFGNAEILACESESENQIKSLNEALKSQASNETTFKRQGLPARTEDPESVTCPGCKKVVDVYRKAPTVIGDVHHSPLPPRKPSG